MVHFVDGLAADPGGASKLALRHPPFAKAVDSIILIIACISFAKNFTDLKPACQDFGRKIQIPANSSEKWAKTTKILGSHIYKRAEDFYHCSTSRYLAAQDEHTSDHLNGYIGTERSYSLTSAA